MYEEKNFQNNLKVAKKKKKKGTVPRFQLLIKIFLGNFYFKATLNKNAYN